MVRTLFDYIGLIITSLGTFFGGIGIYLAVNSSVPIKDLTNNLTYTLIILTFTFFVLFLVFLKKNINNSGYIHSYDIISDAFSISHKLRDSDAIASLPNCIQSLQDFCTYISDAFTKMSKRSTAVCIKLFHIADNGDVCVKTFCRDSKSRESKKRIKPEEDDNLHYLHENTDFKYIFENACKNGSDFKYYMSNILPFEDFYRNSRIDPEKYPPKSNTPIIKEIKRYFAWHLPYKSSITVPITPLTDRKINEGQIIGYLCIDSDFLWTYNRKLDVKILRGIADGLYPTMKKVSETHFQDIRN